jgi:hypothetical protein
VYGGLGHLPVLRQGAVQSRVSIGDDVVGCNAGVAGVETETRTGLITTRHRPIPS